MRINDLEFQVMSCLYQAEGWKHGWPIQHWMEHQFGLKVRAQSIYKVLAKLNDDKLVEFRWANDSPEERSLAGSQRKMYRLTDAGVEALMRSMPEMQAVADRLSKSIRENQKAEERRRRKEG